MHIRRNIQTFSAAITLIVLLIIVTPLCGFLFLCGCDWPWSGLDVDCNFYQLYATQKCPWCTSVTAGGMSVGSAIMSGVLAAAFIVWPLKNRHALIEVAARTLVGLTVFILFATITASITAARQNYPFGVGSYMGNVENKHL